jgi:predicted ATP-binding protein involved in virulence
MIKTIFGQDAYSGKLSVFSSIQLLMKLLVIGSFFLKNKVLEVHSILMGPAGSGKSKFLNMIQSIFGDLSKEIHMESYFVSSEMNSSRSNSEETIFSKPTCWQKGKSYCNASKHAT